MVHARRRDARERPRAGNANHPSTLRRFVMQFARPVMLALSLLALASAPAFAAGDSKSGSTSKNTSTSAASGSSSGAKNDEFARMDKNHDGKISRQEWRDAHKASAAGGSSSKSTH